MALASDLMGLGVSPLIAQRTATGGIGPLTLAVAGTSLSTATKLGTAQFIVTATGPNAGGLLLPVIGGDTGAFLADDYVINNTGTSSIIIYTNPNTVLLSARGSNSSQLTLQIHTSITLYPVSTGQWIGIMGN